jgi:branched-chain amino acid transport system substrate-binding protein
LGASPRSLALVVVAGASAAPSGPPIRIGSTPALTGPLASTALVHQLVGEIYVEQINKKNGLLGRPVEWIVKDDQSKPDLARTLYEQLITVDKVDLLMGPYATGAILSAMGVAQRYNKVLVHHTFGIPSLAKYDAHFPTWSLGADPAATFPNTLLDALATTPKPPKTVAIVTSKFPSVHFMSLGAREAVKKRGLQRWCSSNGISGTAISAPCRPREGCKPRPRVGRCDRARRQPIARRDEKIDYTPPLHATRTRRPARWRRRLEAKNALAATIFEEHAPYLNNPGAAEFVKLFNERAAKAASPTPPWKRRRRRRTRHGRCSMWRSPRPRAWTTRCSRTGTEEQGRYDPGQASLRRTEQLRRRPHGREAGRTAAGSPSGRRASRLRAPR